MSSKPHVIFTLVDDWGYELWPTSSSEHLQLLPQIKRLFVDDGMQIARHYTMSYCAPSRQSLLSGRLPLHVNEENSVCSGIPRGMQTIADRLKEGGYKTHFVGKWHAGYGDLSATPCRRGFDTSLGFYMKAHHHFTHCSYLGFEYARHEHNQCRSAPSNRSQSLTDFFVGAHGVDLALGAAHPAVANETYSTTLFTNAALDVIASHDAATPLFLYLAYSAVHKPFLAPAGLAQRAGLAHPPRWVRAPEHRRLCTTPWPAVLPRSPALLSCASCRTEAALLRRAIYSNPCAAHLSLFAAHSCAPPTCVTIHAPPVCVTARSYFKDCPWTRGPRLTIKCRAHHRKGYEAMAVGVDDGLGQIAAALRSKQTVVVGGGRRGVGATAGDAVDGDGAVAAAAGTGGDDGFRAQTMWERTLMVFASDNGGPIGPQASNAPLRGGKDTNLEGGVRTLAALGGGWLPAALRGTTSPAFMHESDWYATLCELAGVSADDGGAARGVPRVDSLSLWPSWLAPALAGTVEAAAGAAQGSLADARASRTGGGPGGPRVIVIDTRRGHEALIDVREGGGAYKLLHGWVCECPECRPCQPCNATAASGQGGCLFELTSDPSELHDLAAEQPTLLRELNQKLAAAVATKWVDRDPINQECWEVPRDEPDHWMEVALARGAVMQPWLKAPSRASAKPRLLYPHLKLKQQQQGGKKSKAEQIE